MALVCFKVEDLGMEYRDVQETVPLNMFVSLCQSEIVPFFSFHCYPPLEEEKCLTAFNCIILS